jgi:hypothetical protein
VESLENRNLLSGLGFDWLSLVGQTFCGPLLPLERLQSLRSFQSLQSLQSLPGLPGATTATSTLLTDGSGKLWSYNASQGYGASAQQIGATGVLMRDLAFDGSSAYYGVDNASPNHQSTSALYGIGFSTNPPGNVKKIQKGLLRSTTEQAVDLNSLGYADGALWAAGSAGGSHFLFKIDLTSFSITEQWPLSVASGQYAGNYESAGDIEFNGTTGYITTTSGRLLKFSTSSPGTFQAENILDQGGHPIEDFQGLAFGHFSATNLLLAFRQTNNDVYRLDFNTNQWLQYGSLGSMFPVGLQGATAMSGSVTSVPPPAAEVAVVGGGQFGISLQGLPSIKRTFVVYNKGNEPLTTGPITLPEGFEIAEGLDSVIPPRGCDSFTVRMKTDTPGTFHGDLLIPNNDGDGGDGIEDPVAVPLHGTVVGLHRSCFVPLKATLPKLTEIHRRVESVADRLVNWWATVDAVYSRWIS